MPVTLETLPPAECPLGYPWAQLERILDAQELARLGLWMSGQTGAICEGRRWSSERGAYEPDGCAGRAHGMVVYAHDVRRWLAALPVVD